MKKTFVLLLSAWFTLASAQSDEPSYKFSAGDKSIIITSGFSLPSFDIGGKLYEKQLHDLSPTVNFGFRYLLPKNFALKLFGEYTYYKDDDDYKRGLGNSQYSFSNQIYRGGGRLEYHILGNVTDYEARHNAYVFGGGGIAHAESEVVGIPDANHAINTTPVTTPLLLAGIGYQYRFARNFALGLDLSYEYYFSDYIEGFHTNWSKSNDVAYGAMLTVSYFFSRNYFHTKKCRCEDN
ncbi:MAG: hypothetical protein H6Q19_1288 [Bacteroidetes bacterium]|nr:hypothetical protein [Bacteroidota bacterium]